MEQKVCGLCGRSYGPKLQGIHLTLGKDDQPEPVFDYDICFKCTYKVSNLILAIQLTRPKKCEFCEFDIRLKYYSENYTKKTLPTLKKNSINGLNIGNFASNLAHTLHL